jgi:PAS domain S-box-containing protein
MKSIAPLLNIYDSGSFVIRLKAKFVLFTYFVVIASILSAICYTSYANLIDPSLDYSVNIEILILYLSGLAVLLSGLFLITRGYYSFASHLLIACSLSLVWAVIIFNKTAVISKLDTIVLTTGILSMLPIVVSKRPVSMLFYAGVNLIVLYMYILLNNDTLNLSRSSIISYLADNTIATIGVTLIAFSVFSINKQALDKAETDYAEKMKAEEALRSSELFRMRVFDVARIPIVVMDPFSFRFVELNEAAVRAYGFKSREELLHKTHIDVSATHQYDKMPSSEKSLFYIQKALKEGSAIFNWKHQRPDGTQWDAEVHLLSFTTEDKVLLQFSLIDITEKEKARSALIQSEKKYRTLMENLNEVIMMVDNDDKILFVNKKFTEKLGYAPEEILGKIGYQTIVSKENQEIIKENNLKRLRKETSQYEMTFIAKNGKVIEFLINGAPIVNTEGKTIGSIGAMVDITDRKNAENALRESEEKFRLLAESLEKLVSQRTQELASINQELNISNNDLLLQHQELENALENLKTTQKQLIQSEKMASLGVLSAGVAHEINNPLNFIYNGTAAIEKYIIDKCPAETENIKPLFNAVNQGVSRITGIVRSMNRYSREENLPLTRCNIQDVIDNCLILLNDKFYKRIEVRKNYIPDSPSLPAHEGQLHQAFLNILVNCAQAIENEGKVTIDVTHVDDYLNISITDTGKGIPAENIDHIFDPFFTTKEPGAGIGLGLAITKKIIDENNGTIWCDSRLGEGTTINTRFPVNNHS